MIAGSAGLHNISYRSKSINFGQFMSSIAEVKLHYRHFSSKLSYPITETRLLQYVCPNGNISPLIVLRASGLTATSAEA